MNDKVEKILEQNWLTSEDLCDVKEYQAIDEDEEVLEEGDDHHDYFIQSAEKVC